MEIALLTVLGGLLVLRMVLAEKRAGRLMTFAEKERAFAQDRPSGGRRQDRASSWNGPGFADRTVPVGVDS